MNPIDLILDTYRRKLYPAVRKNKRKNISRYDTSDIIQESLVQIWQDIEENPGFEPNATYLSKVASGKESNFFRFNTALKRSLNNETALTDQEAESPDDSPQQRAEKNEILIHILRAVGDLPVQLRELFCKKIFDQKTFQQIASELGISADVARRGFHRAMRLTKLEMAKVLGSQNG